MEQKTKFKMVGLRKKDVISLVGDDALPIVKFLEGKTDVSEFKIAEDLNLEIHYVRQVLYKLNADNLVIYIRKKDSIKGWYISYWTLNLKRFKELIPRLEKKNLNKLKKRLNNESLNQFYLCKNLCTRLNFENAFDFNFKCSECGELLNHQDNSRTIKFLKEKILQLEKVKS